MPIRTTRRQAADVRSRAALAMLARELRQARRLSGLSQGSVAAAATLSRSKVSRVELGNDADLSIADAMALLAAVGLDLSVRVFPGGDPIRDVAHTALLERLRAQLHPSLGWQTEVPLPIPGDRRAWDAIIRGSGWLVGVEAETHADDRQALERKVTLKARDGGVTRVLVVLARTSANRQFIESNRSLLRQRFPAGARETLAALRAGRPPSSDGLLLI